MKPEAGELLAVENTLEINNNSAEQNSSFKYSGESGDNENNTSNIEVCSPCIVKPPTHFHHPEYINEVLDNEKQKMVVGSRQITNIHPETGIDRTSLIDDSNIQPFAVSTKSWYSHWKDKEDIEQLQNEKRRKEQRKRKNEEEVLKLPCSLGKMVLKEQDNLEALQERQTLDPRLASRSPGANDPLCSKPRYNSPIHSSPSRTLREAREVGTSFQNLLSQDTKADGSFTSNEDQFENSTFILVNQEHKMTKGQSMPEITGKIKIFPYHILATTNRRLPRGVDRTQLERHLAIKEFENLFCMTREEFYRQPKWKRMDMKKKVNLF
uniref:dematin-like isoform X3 n=1 Tax=Ciona intestinalis TaxID=7719 RepID=UPI00052187BF|nr:dematin-like isoform X3 [Ciona intestinalis]|eukprot:XP_009858536.1 dematin-like isoform X3 [Ciona intestinalis]